MTVLYRIVVHGTENQPLLRFEQTDEAFARRLFVNQCEVYPHRRVVLSRLVEEVIEERKP